MELFAISMEEPCLSPSASRPADPHGSRGDPGLGLQPRPPWPVPRVGLTARQICRRWTRDASRSTLSRSSPDPRPGGWDAGGRRYLAARLPGDRGMRGWDHAGGRRYLAFPATRGRRRYGTRPRGAARRGPPWAWRASDRLGRVAGSITSATVKIKLAVRRATRSRYIPDPSLKRQIPGGAPPPIYG